MRTDDEKDSNYPSSGTFDVSGRIVIVGIVLDCDLGLQPRSNLYQWANCTLRFMTASAVFKSGFPIHSNPRCLKSKK